MKGNCIWLLHLGRSVGTKRIVITRLSRPLSLAHPAKVSDQNLVGAVSFFGGVGLFAEANRRPKRKDGQIPLDFGEGRSIIGQVLGL